jgi:hypothetical protein
MAKKKQDQPGVPLDPAHGYNGPAWQRTDRDEEKIVVKFLRPYPPWQTGELAGFPKSKAMILVQPIGQNLGGPIAELYVPPKKMEEKE